MKEIKYNNLRVRAFDSGQEMGKFAAAFVRDELEKAIQEKGTARLILATGASQFDFLDSLKKSTTIPWEKVTVFHLDEYLGMPDTHPASFRKYLKDRILEAVRPGEVHYLEGDSEEIEREIDRYSNLLRVSPVDVACIGIGENGHIAFNDPPVADFDDPHLVKIVELDDVCRRQQLGEGWFEKLADVPAHAITLTIPAIMDSRVISCVVPDKRKVQAVTDTLYGPVSVSCPASILRTHPNAILWLDNHSVRAIRF